MFSHRIFSVILSILLLCFISSAQEVYKIGETASIRGNTSENPDINVAVEKMKSIPKAKLAIVSYGLPGLAIRRMNGIKKYYEIFFDVNNDDLISIYGGYENSGEANLKLRAEFWIIPKNAAIPEVSPIYPKESYLFDEYNWGIGETSYPSDDSPVIWFTEFSKNNSQNEAYLIYYGYRDKNFNISLSKVRDKALQTKRRLTTSGKNPLRVTIMPGGYDKDWAHIEFWVVPPGAIPPKPISVNKNSSKN